MIFDDTLLERLRNNDSTLTTVDLRENDDISDLDIKNLADALEENKTVEKLTLGGIGDVSNEYIKHLTRALEKNKTLKTLNLGGRPTMTTEWLKDLGRALEKNQTLTELGLFFNRFSFLRNIDDFTAALEKSQTLRKLVLFRPSVAFKIEDLGDKLENNFSLCEIEFVGEGAKGIYSRLPKKVENLFRRNQALQAARQGATTALNALKETLPIPRGEIDKKRTELNLSPTEAHAVIQFEGNIRLLNDAILRLRGAQFLMARKTSESAERVKKELQQLHDECLSESTKLPELFVDAMKNNLNVAINSIIDGIPESSPPFNHARFLLFQTAYNNYQLVDHYPPTQALVEALPLLTKEDGTLLTDFMTASKDIEGMRFSPEKQQRIFDIAVLTAAGHAVKPAGEIALTNDARADLLRFVLLRYAKDITTDVKHSKMAGTLFAGTKKETPAPLRKSLATLPSSFDVTKAEERENVRKLFDEAYGDLGDLLSKKPKETEAINDLKNCHELMAPLSTKPITPEVSPKPAK